ncbi:MAG: hypothetical protein JWL86_2824, partial [Rhizobium sp.]|nr:hypothetical protein [Rhizobium sp.]
LGFLVELSGFDKSDRQIDAFNKSFRNDPFDVFRAKCEADFERQLKQVATQDMGQIRMLPGMAADGRLKIDEVGYSLRRRENAVDAPGSGAGLRVGLSRLLVEWKWGEEDQARLCEECHTIQGRIGHLANANPGLVISPAERDVARLRIGTKPKDAGTGFPPRPDLAIVSFVFPEARLVDGSRHAFSIHAAKQDLCLGQWNPDSQLFEELTIDGQRLREAYETTRHAAELALAEVEGEFPSDGGWKCLGTRIAQVVEEPAIEQQPGSR